MRLLLLAVLIATLVGCALTLEEITQISDRAAFAAETRVKKEVEKKLLEQGVAVVEAQKLALIAGKKASDLARKAVEAAIPVSQDEKSSKTGAAVMTALMAGLQLLAGVRATT